MNSCPISVTSDHRIISVNIRLILRANNKKYSKIKHYDWARLKTDTETRYTFITKVKTKYEALHDTTASLSANKRYYHFGTVCKETAAKVILLKSKLKKLIPWKKDNICQNLIYYTKQRDINKINRYQKMSDISTKLKSILYNRMRRNKHITLGIK